MADSSNGRLLTGMPDRQNDKTTFVVLGRLSGARPDRRQWAPRRLLRGTKRLHNPSWRRILAAWPVRVTAGHETNLGHPVITSPLTPLQELAEQGVQ